MAVATVIFDGTRLNASDSNTGWGNYNTGGGAPASEAANAYQQNSSPSSVGAVGKKVNSTTPSSRIGVDYLGSSVNYSGNDYLWYCKIYVADSFDLNTTYGVEVSFGSGNGSNYYEYNIAGSGSTNDEHLNYPRQGGYILAAIDPTVSLWPVAQSGTINPAAIIWYAVGATFIGGFAKSENVAMDAIDYGRGLILTQGGGGDPVPNFTEFLAFDQNIKANRYGVVSGSVTGMQARGKLIIGDSTGSNATNFLDSATILTYKDGFVNTNSQGTFIYLNNVSDDVQINNTIIGAGRAYIGVDTRPNFEVTGNSGIFRGSCNLRNHYKIALTSSCILDGADIECVELSNAGEIKNSVIRTDAAGTTACIINPSVSDFGTTSGIHDVEFIQSGSFAAIKLIATSDLTPPTYTFTNIQFTGYGATTNSNAAIYVAEGAGTAVVINVTGGDSPTYYAPNGASVTVNNTVGITITVLDADTLNPIQDARVHITAGSGGPLSAGTIIYDGTVEANVTNASGQISTAFSFTSNQPITGRIRKSTAADGTLYQQGTITGTITSSGFETAVILIKDE